MRNFIAAGWDLRSSPEQIIAGHSAALPAQLSPSLPRRPHPPQEKNQHAADQQPAPSSGNIAKSDRCPGGSRGSQKNGRAKGAHQGEEHGSNHEKDHLDKTSDKGRPQEWPPRGGIYLTKKALSLAHSEKKQPQVDLQQTRTLDD